MSRNRTAHSDTAYAAGRDAYARRPADFPVNVSFRLW